MGDRTTHGLPRFLPPDLPQEIQPIPFEKKPISLLGLTEFRAAKFAKVGIFNFEQLENYLAQGGELTEIDSIGPTWAEKIMDKFSIYLEERVPEEHRSKSNG